MSFLWEMEKERQRREKAKEYSRKRRQENKGTPLFYRILDRAMDSNPYEKDWYTAGIGGGESKDLDDDGLIWGFAILIALTIIGLTLEFFGIV